MNLVVLKGNIGSMEDLKQIGGDSCLVKFTLATNKRIKGEDKTTWHRCIAWRKTAEHIAQYFNKGDQILVTGEIDNDSYEDKDGKKVYTSEVIVERAEFCGPKSDNNQNQNNQNQGTQTGSSWNQNNGGQQQQQNNTQNQQQSGGGGGQQQNQQQHNAGNFNNPRFDPDDDIPF